MKTKKQQELIDSFLDTLDNELAVLYREIVVCLSNFNYYPRKQRSYIIFKHDSHNKGIAKMGMNQTKDASPYFALRFSACKEYSQWCADIVKNYIAKNSDKLFPHCEDGKCIFSEDGDRTPFYEYTSPDGESESFCGKKTLIIPDITRENIEEIKNLIKEEHEYLLEHETENKSEASPAL